MNQPNAAEEPLLKVENLSIAYRTKFGDVPAVVDFNLTVYPEDKIGIVGESGCGKSTAAYAIMRYLGGSGAVTSGRILFEGKNMLEMSAEEIRDIRGKRISMIYQEPMAALNPTMRIGAQLMEVPLYHEANVSKAEAKERSMNILADVQMPDPKRIFQSYPHELSGGQQQRVVIALGLLSNPALLIMDEPTTALDVTVEKEIIELVDEVCEKYRAALVFISHNLGLVMNTCTKITVMYSGQTVERGRTEDVFAKMLHPYTDGLFRCIPRSGANKYTNPLTPIEGQPPLAWERPPGCFYGPRCQHFKTGVCDTEMPPLISDGENTEHVVRCARIEEIRNIPPLEAPPGAAYSEPGSVAVSVKNLKKYYKVGSGVFAASGAKRKTVKANDDISFDCREREILAIVGESGCGKSTLAKVMIGLEKATAGSLELFNTEIAKLPIQKRSSDLIGKVQMIFQNPNDTLNPKIPVGKQIARTIRKFGTASGKEIAEKVTHLLESVRIPAEYAAYRPSNLSGGQKQRISIARTFAANPSLIIADEPVSALDVSVQAAIVELLTDMREAYDNTLVIISHDLSLVKYLADKTVVMYLGGIMEQGTVEEVYNPPFHPYTEALLSAAPFIDATDRKKQRKLALKGELPSPVNPPAGCAFCTRCPFRIGDICDNIPPPVQKVSYTHRIACHIPVSELISATPGKQTLNKNQPAAV